MSLTGNILNNFLIPIEMKIKNSRTPKNPVSLLIFLLLAFGLLASRFLLPRFLTYDVLSIISWDVFGYYLYLPAYLIHHDLGLRDFTWVQQVLDTYHPTQGFYQAYAGPAGDYIMKYPMGLSILYAPFFLLAHAVAGFFGYSPDGFSLPYQVSIAFGMIVYAVAGIWFLRKILLKFYSDQVTTLVMIMIVLGTNFFELTAFDGAMPHNALFLLFALIVWFTIRWHERPSMKFAFPLGLLIGLSVLLRPTSGVIILVPLLWSAGSRESWKAKLELIIKNRGQVILLVLMAGIVISFQLIYWKIHSGSWLYYSYEKNEKLEWFAPYLWKVLFSYKKGWLVYAPIMFFILPGFCILGLKNRQVFWPVFVFFIVNLLIVSSWPNWWYGGSFGQRALMESSVLLAFPLAASVRWILDRDWFLKGPVFFTIAFLIVLNLFQTWQYMNFILDPSRMTKKYYWTVFGKTNIRSTDLAYLEAVETNEREFLKDEQNFIPRLVGKFDFEQVDQNNPGPYTKEFAKTGNNSFRLDQKTTFSPGLFITFNDLTKNEFVWIRASGYVFFTCPPGAAKCSLVITVNQKGKSYKYRMIPMEEEGLVAGQWNKVSMDYLTPFISDRKDVLQAYFWNRGENAVFVDDFEISVFEPNN